MSKLRGADKEAFLKRMAAGRRKAARKNPKPKKAKAAAKKTPAKKKTKAKSASKLRGKAKEAFLKRMAAGRRKAVRNGSPKKKAGTKKKGRRNPDTIEAAAQKFAEFHGKPASRIIELEQTYRYPENFAEMGKLKELRFDLNEDNLDFPLKNFRGTKAVCTPDGANIYFLEGDQSIDFDALDIASDKDMVELGPCCYISYHTVKGFHDFEPTDYWHRFGEEDEIYPVLAYDRLNKALFLIGGNYRVRPEGIVN